MKVALIIDTWFPFVGGGQINSWEITRRIATTGVHVDIITRNNGEEHLSLPKNLRIIKVPTSQKVETYDFVSKIIFLIRSFMYIYKRDYGLVHAHAFLPGISARLLMVFKGIPAILTVHGTSLGTNLLNPVARFIEKFILTQILYTAQITVSRDFLNLKNINKRILFIPNGVNTKDFDRIKEAKNKNPTLLFVGRLHKQKNLFNLIEAIAQLREDFPKLTTFIVGDGPLKTELQKAVTDSKLRKNVFFIKRALGKDLIKLYKKSWALILPSIYEGQPLSLLESWAAKTPVIASRVGDCPYLIKDRYNGYLIKNHLSPIEMAKTIKKALVSKNLSMMGERGYNLVKSNFTWDKATEGTLNLYEEITKNPACRQAGKN